MRNVRLLRPYSGWIAVVVGLLGVFALTDTLQPYFLKLLIDDVFIPGADGDWSLLWIILPAMGLAYVVRNFLFYVTRMRSLRISEDLCFDLRQRLFEHMQRLSLRFYKSHRPGKISARLLDDTFKIQSFIHEKLPTLLRYVLEFQVLLIIIYMVNWRLAIASTIVLPLHFWTYRRFRMPIRRSHSEAQEQIAVAHGSVVEKFLGMEVVKGFSGEEREEESFRDAIDASRRSKIQLSRYQFAQKVVADLIIGLGTVMLLGYGAWEVRNARMTGGEFLMFFMYVKMLYPAVLEITSGAAHLTKATASADRVFEMLAEPAGDPPGQGREETGVTLRGGIELEDVSFTYEDGTAPVLDGVTLTIEPGEHVAITGSSGSGKSTLISLLPAFNHATLGTVSVDGRPVRDLRLRTLRGLFGLVFQEVFLFNASIDENLRYARPDATMEEVVAACRITGAHEFIERLPHGYYTRIGGPGGELSRGEKQRITLARALIRNPGVLILDEATASIDNAAAHGILQSILERMRDRTVIMVTHDHELLDLVDRVVTIERGRVVFDGPPEHCERPATLPSPTVGALMVDPLPAPGAPAGPRGHGRPLRGGRLAPTLAFAGAILALALDAGCAREERTESAVTLESPRLSSGVVLETKDRAQLVRFAEALDAITLDPDGIRPGRDDAVAAPADAGAHAGTGAGAGAHAAADADEHAGAVPLGLAGDLARTPSFPPDTVRLVSLPKLSTTEINELIDRIALQLNATEGYAEVGEVLARKLPSLPSGVSDGRLLARATENGARVIRFGHRPFISQPPQLWVFGATIEEGQPLAPNPDLEPLPAAVGEMIASLEAMRSELTVQELESKIIQLSYIDAPGALKLLDGLGETTIDDPGAVPEQIDFRKLPYVVLMPDPDPEYTGLIGEGGTSQGRFGVSLTPSLASPLKPNTVSAPMTQILVMYHPAHPEQFSRVRRLLDEFVDRPARQIFVEGMVLEISEDGLRDLGVEWELNSPPLFWRIGSPRADGLTDTFEFDSFNLDDFPGIFSGQFMFDWSIRIRTLIRDGKAEILSRPSVLTINNRQSTIRVGQDIPIATSQEGTAVGSKISFSFEYLATGILLNIRPRINEDGSQVSLLVDTVVSAAVPGADLELRAANGDLLASAPTVATRRVQTYARIRNNTPFIIGGLVNRQHTTQLDKVPFLGDLPILGAAFRAERTETTKREVIIVLTPYVLPEDQIIARSLPRDDDRFDNVGDDLFRESYRIRAEDVFDLSFLAANDRLTEYRALAKEAMIRDFRLKEREPFASFAAGSVPGENVLVTRMIYDVVKRLGKDDQIDLGRTIFLESQKIGGFDVVFLERALARLGDGSDWHSFFGGGRGRALAITFTAEDRTATAGGLSREPVPQLSIVDCPDREAWSDLLWKLNQPDPDGRERHTILIHQQRDLDRLRVALLLKRIIDANGGEGQLRLDFFSTGKMLLMPDLEERQIHLVNDDVARIFFHSEHYYAAAIRLIETRLNELDRALRDPAVRVLLDGVK